MWRFFICGTVDVPYKARVAPMFAIHITEAVFAPAAIITVILSKEDHRVWEGEDVSGG